MSKMKAGSSEITNGISKRRAATKTKEKDNNQLPMIWA